MSVPNWNMKLSLLLGMSTIRRCCFGILIETFIGRFRSLYSTLCDVHYQNREEVGCNALRPATMRTIC